jgi:alpha-1,3-rhamnosyl/mannosyltransferase
MRRNGVDGIGSYTRELGKCLANDPSIDLTPVCFGAPPPEDPGFSGRPVRSLGRYVRYAGISAITPFGFPDSGLRDLDLFHATDHLIARFSRYPVIATLMDAIPLSHPEWVRMRFVHLKNWLWRRAAHWADHILTISDYSKQDISRYFGIGTDKISVVPLGVDARYFERFDSELKRQVVNKLGLPEQFYLFVGTIQPRKNLERLLDAHATLSLSRQKDVPLVIVGRLGWGCEALMARLNDESLQGRVYWSDYLPDMEVRILMQMARALVFPSLYEGFGLPVVEAFASGLPVITSNTTSLPEVAGDAALLVNPLDAGELGDAMRQIIEAPGLSERLCTAGERRAHELTWSACARRTRDIYRKVLGHR